jgi:hypothetical protein
MCGMILAMDIKQSSDGNVSIRLRCVISARGNGWLWRSS